MKTRRQNVPEEVGLIREQIRAFLDTVGANSQPIGNCKHGVYAFYDYDSEPIYVGQTFERLRSRIGRHLTNQRTDAVAMNVLDPFEVAYIEVWPFFDLADAEKDVAQSVLDRAEFAVFQNVLAASEIGQILNEKPVAPAEPVALPTSYRACIIPDDVYARRNHPDIRIARRASTIARLAQVISERDVSKGLRQTLLTQAQRLERLAQHRLDESEESTDSDD